MDNNAAFWDKRYSQEEVKKILSDEADPKFIETAATLLSRFNKPGEVFNLYLNKITFCNNWRKIKRRMRKNKWSDSRIIFWDEVYKVALQDIDKSMLKRSRKRDVDSDPEIKRIGDIVRGRRKAYGWTQAELAKRSKLSQQTISFVEKGYVNISVKTLKRIADTLRLRFVVEPSEESVTTQIY